MNVLIIQPGFPAEIPYFVRGLARSGARVLGIGDQPKAMLPDVAREGLSAYLQVHNLWNDDAVIDAVRQWDLPIELDRVECLWEPGMVLAAALREAFGLPGMDRDQTTLFRDKELMKQALDKAGVRTPRHFSAKSEPEIRTAVEKIGYPLIIKPISGAGSADTYKVTDAEHLETILPLVRGVKEVSVEEWIAGDEHTYDTICADGAILYDNVAHYRPNVLLARSEEWISPQTITLRDMESDLVKKGRKLGAEVIKALGFQTGFTHMEWFHTAKGEAVFGEIGARPPGGRSVELMNYACDIDVFSGWGEALVDGKLRQEVARKYNSAVIFKRAQGQGFIRRIEGLEDIHMKFGKHIVCTNLLEIGEPRRNWKQTLISDGYIILRHEDLATCQEMADYVGENLQIYAGP